MGYFFVFVVFAITYNYTNSFFVSFLVALCPFTIVSMHRSDKKEEVKLDTMSPEDRDNYIKLQQDARQRIEKEETLKFENKIRYQTAAQIISKYCPQICSENFSTSHGKYIWCNDQELTNKIAKIVKLEFKNGGYHLLDEEDTLERAKKICSNHGQGNYQESP